MKRVGSCGRFRARSRAARRRKRPGRSLSRRASDNGNYGNRQPNRSGANPAARSAPDSLTVSRPPRTIAAREAQPTFACGPADMQSGERKSAAECMFMHRLQSEGKAIRTPAARAPEPEVRAAHADGKLTAWFRTRPAVQCSFFRSAARPSHHHARSPTASGGNSSPIKTPITTSAAVGRLTGSTWFRARHGRPEAGSRVPLPGWTAPRSG